MKKVAVIVLLCFAHLFCLAQDNVDDALAYQYYQQGQYQQAVVLLEKLFNNTRSDAYFELYFNSLLKLKRFDDAEKTVKKLIRQNPKNLQYGIALARIYQDKGQTDAANKLYMQVIANLPADEFKIREIANHFYSFQAYDLAISAFLQGRKILNNEQPFTYELLSIYRYKKDKHMLVQEYLNALPQMPQLLPQAESVLATVFEDNSDYQLLQSALLKKIQKEPQTEVYTKLLIWQYLQQQEYEMALRQLMAQDKRTRDDGGTLFNAAGTFIDNKAYPTAIEAYEYILSKGKESPWYLPAKVEMINAKYQLVIAGHFDKKAITELAAAYQAIIDEYGKSRQTIFALKKWANLQAYYLDDLPKAENALEELLKTPGIPATEAGQAKLDLGDIYILTQQPWEAFLIYEQVAKQFDNQEIGNEARYRSARLSFYQGNFAYAKSQSDVLKASTSQLISNDALNLSLLIADNLQTPTDSNALKMYADAEMLQFRNLPMKAIAKLDSINIAFPNNSLTDDILMAKSKIYIKSNETDKAVAALKAIIDLKDSSIWADDALFTLADLYEKSGKDNEQAKNLYQKLINDYPGSMYTAEARKRFRKLRGDNVGT
ncbi:tetratricopeptide repeat protein [Pedobacter heparinus]|uniref:Tetratricopeptide TPR_3 n=1 Tax=Pedobacter heparinus (strain ATCC 13125 / DSM 2366 / CIP 104194 / JCM 7457 / NBRC 12017 / NCIMB 9290 / NRRL B-14731 / HIM 762-3) TaxID=485917 RepID=C6XZA5_PEDHD|nr:tetratricopeptide repeat protein [Pedobacter heparinus]ACU02587.1 Tetratricopeptide TPR_3 [Pedobacter heparinus DSM 2366]